MRDILDFNNDNTSRENGDRKHEQDIGATLLAWHRDFRSSRFEDVRESVI